MPLKEEIDGKFASYEPTYSSPMYTVRAPSECCLCLASCPQLWCCRDQMPDTPQSPSTKYQYRLSATEGCCGTTYINCCTKHDGRQRTQPQYSHHTKRGAVPSNGSPHLANSRRSQGERGAGAHILLQVLQTQHTPNGVLCGLASRAH